MGAGLNLLPGCQRVCRMKLHLVHWVTRSTLFLNVLNCRVCIKDTSGLAHLLQGLKAHGQSFHVAQMILSGVAKFLNARVRKMNHMCLRMEKHLIMPMFASCSVLYCVHLT